jgi:hypothetical protein
VTGGGSGPRAAGTRRADGFVAYGILEIRPIVRDNGAGTLTLGQRALDSPVLVGSGLWKPTASGSGSPSKICA